MLAQAVPARFVMPGAPLAVPGGSGRSWFTLGASSTSADVALSRAALDAIVTHLRAQGASRVIVGGFSQGGILSIDLALAGHARIDGIAVLSGRALDGYRSSFRRALARSARVPVARRHRHTHPVRTRRCLPRTGRGGGRDSVSFHRFAGGHTIPPDVDSALAAWLGEACAP